MATARQERVARAFGASIAHGQQHTDFIEKLRALEKLLLQENKLWWDFTTLHKYVEKEMMPRGLRIKKLPTTVFSEEFLTEWNGILTHCSTQLINLIIKYEEPKIALLSEEVKKAEQDLQEYKDLNTFDEEYKKLKNNVDKNEEWIASIKQNKFQRDLFDYAHNQVYTWKNKEHFRSNPGSILKRQNFKGKRRQKPKNSQHISFSSSSAESAGDITDVSDNAGISDNRSAGSSQQSAGSSSRISKKTSNSSKNDEGGAGGSTKVGVQTRKMQNPP